MRLPARDWQPKTRFGTLALLVLVLLYAFFAPWIAPRVPLYVSIPLLAALCGLTFAEWLGRRRQVRKGVDREDRHR